MPNEHDGAAGDGTKEVVILVGRQGSGKTRYCGRHLPHHVRVCQDEGPRHFSGLLRHYQRLLDEGTGRIVIDRTNPTPDRRAAFAAPARAMGYRVRIVYFDVPREVCERRVLARGSHPTLDAGQMRQAMNAFESRLVVPTENGCDELLVIRDAD